MTNVENPVLPLDRSVETMDLSMNARMEAAIRQEAELITALQPEKITDKADFMRQEITISDGVTVIFKEREELPLFQDAGEKVTGVVGEIHQTSDKLDQAQAPQRPLQTSTEDYSGWLAKTTGDDYLGDPFEIAADSGKDVRLIVTSNPTGLIDGTLKLMDAGVLPSDEQGINRLEKIRGKLLTSDIDQEVVEVIDMITAASLVKLADEASAVEVGYGSHSEPGLAEVMLALSGDARAQEVISIKQHILKARDAAKVVLENERLKSWAAEQHEGSEVADHIKMPGEQLTKEELKVLADQHLVAVHTTQQDPQSRNNVIAPTSAYLSNFNRQTIHWSLNHPVGNVPMNDFSGRAFTVLSRLEDLVAINGAPRSLNSVDTYFMVEVGDGLVVPPDTTILEVTQAADVAEAIDFSTNGRIELKGGTRTASDYSQILTGLSEHYGMTKENVVSWLSRRHVFNRQFGGSSYRLNKAKEMYAKSANTDDVYEKATLEGEIHTFGPGADIEQAVAGLMGIDVPTDGKEQPNRDYELSAALEKLLADDTLLTKYPAIHDLLTEALRSTIIEMEVQQMGGQVQDGGQWGVANQAFEDNLTKTGLRLGIEMRTHFESSEYYGEIRSYTARRVAQTTQKDQDGNEILNEKGEPLKTNYDWREYDSQEIWEGLGNSLPAMRRLAVLNGDLSYGRRQAPAVGHDTAGMF